MTHPSLHLQKNCIRQQQLCELRCNGAAFHGCSESEGAVMQGQESGGGGLGSRMGQKRTTTVLQASYLQLLPPLPHGCKQGRHLPEKSVWLAGQEPPGLPF